MTNLSEIQKGKRGGDAVREGNMVSGNNPQRGERTRKGVGGRQNDYGTLRERWHQENDKDKTQNEVETRARRYED